MNKNISKTLIESFGYQFNEDGRAALLDPEVAARVAARASQGAKPAIKSLAGKAWGKVAGKIVPGVALGLEASDAYEYAKKGDWVGAGLSGLAGAAYLVPGYGWMVGGALDAAKWARDYMKGDEQPAANEPAADPTTTPGGAGSGKPAAKPQVANNKISQIQKVVGAKPDGIMGPETKEKLKAWQQAHGLTADGIPGPNTMAAITREHNKFVQLQKVIGVSPDGYMGPETSAKLKSWQASKGISADGIPGPDTYKAAGISEGLSVVDSISALRTRLAMIEAAEQSAATAPVIVNKNDKLYAVLPDGRLIDQQGNLIDGSKEELPVVGKADDVNPSEIFNQTA